MARSEYIYVLQQIEDGAILATCTVKRELVAILNRGDMTRETIEKTCRFIRFPDGRGSPFLYDWKNIP
jgi:hypothetical protein